MAAIGLPARSILKVDGYTLSEHSRQPLEVDFEVIEFAKRTVSGQLRVYQTAKKLRLSTSWELLPSQTEFTLDGYLGAIDLINLYRNSGEVQVEVWTDAESAHSSAFATYDFPGRISEFNSSIAKRNVEGRNYDFWDISLSLEEL